jgi:hypothetical protein
VVPDDWRVMDERERESQKGAALVDLSLELDTANVFLRRASVMHRSDVLCSQSSLCRRFALRNFAHTNFYNEAHSPHANSLIRNLQNKIEYALTKTQTKDATSPNQSVKPGEVLYARVK